MDKVEGWKLVPVGPTDHMRGLGRAMQLGGTATARNIYQTMLTAAPTPPAPIAWPHECEELCKSAEQFQQAVNELWKAENPDELQDGDTAMIEEDARELHSERWKALESAIYYMRKRMSAPPTTTPPAQEFPWEPCNEGCAEVGKTQHCTCEQAKAFMAAQEPHTAIRTLKEGINTVPAHPDIGDTPPAQEAEPVAYLHEWTEWHPFGSTEAGQFTSTIDCDPRPKSRDDTVTPLYTRPANDELRKAAEEFFKALDTCDLDAIGIAQNALRGALGKK